MENAKIRLSEQFVSLALECEQEVLTVSELIHVLGVRGHAFVALLFTIPFVAPIPLPGLSVPFGLVAMISGFGISFGFELWLPRSLMHKSLPGHLLSKAFRAASVVMKKIETWRLLKPRLFVVSESRIMRAIAGLLIALSGLLLAMPLPPGTNFPPAAVCVLLALGILERDGVLLLAGIAMFAANIGLVIGLWVYARPWLMQWFS